MILSVNLCIVKKIRDMKTFMTVTTLVSLALGAILLAGGNDLGSWFILPGVVYTLKTAE